MNKLEFALGAIVCITVLESVALFMNLDGAYFSLIVGAISTIAATVLTHEWHMKRRNKK